MIRTVSRSLFILIVLLHSSAGAQDWARKMFKVTEHDFGNVARDAKAEFRFEFENLYEEDVHVANVSSTCGCTTPRVENGSLKTYEKGAIVAHVNTDRFLGRKGATLTVTFDKPFYAQVQLRVGAYIRNDVIFDPGSVQFGSVDQGMAKEARVRVQYTGHSNWRIVDVKNANPHLSVQLIEAGRRGGQAWYDLLVKMDDAAPVGYIHDHLLLRTNDPSRAEVPLLVEGSVVSSVVVSPASLFMGVIEPGQEVTKQLVVRGKRPFRILSIECGDENFRFDTSDAGTPKPLHLIPVTFVAGDARGKISRTIRIETDLGTMTVPELAAYAVVSQGMGQ